MKQSFEVDQNRLLNSKVLTENPLVHTRRETFEAEDLQFFSIRKMNDKDDLEEQVSNKF